MKQQHPFFQQKSTGYYYRMTILSFLFFFLFAPPLVRAQKPIDSLIYATDGKINTTKIAGNMLYLGGHFSYIGRKTGGMAFFPNGSSKPDKDWPIFGTRAYGWSSNESNVESVLSDGHGGWYVGGSFSYVNRRQRVGLVHLLPDKTVDENFSVSWEWLHYIHVLKEDGDYLYVGGEFSVKDEQDSLHTNVMRVNRKTGKVDPEWRPLVQSNSHNITHLFINKDYVFLGGWITKVQGVQKDASLIVVDKSKGKLIPFPTCSSVTAMDLVGDTLLLAQPSLYGSKDVNGFGYIAKSVALIDEQNDSISLRQPDDSYFYSSIPDGDGGWYVIGRLNGKDGIHHLDRNLKPISKFQPNAKGFGQFPSAPLSMHGNSLYAGSIGPYLRIDLGNGHVEPHLFKMDTATGAFDTQFFPQTQAGGNIYAIAFQGDTLFVGGKFDSIGGEPRSGLAAINAQTGALYPWHPEIHLDNYEAGFTGGKRIIRTLKIIDGKLYAGGVFQISRDTLDKGTGIYGLARYNIPTGELDTAFHIYTSAWDNPFITGMAYGMGKLFIVGDFSLTSSTDASTVIKDAAWVDINRKKVYAINKKITFNSHVYVYDKIPGVAFHNDKIYFRAMSAKNTETGVMRDYLFALDPETGKFLRWNPATNGGPFGGVYTFSFYNKNIFFSGGFYFLHYHPGYVAGINIKNKQYVTIPGGYTIHSIVHTDKYIFMGGDFTRYNDSIVHGLFRLKRKGLAFTPYHHKIMTGTDQAAIRYLAIGQEGLYATGIYWSNFDNVGGVERHNVCLLDVETGQLKTWNPPLSNGWINKVFAHGKDVMVSGDFNLMPAWARSDLARINLKTGKVDNWNPIVNTSYPGILDLLASGDTLYLLGNISKINTVDAGKVCAISNQSGSLFSGFQPPVINDYYKDYSKLLCKKGNSLFVKVGTKEIKKLNAQTGTDDNWPVQFTDGDIYSVFADSNDVYIGGYHLQLESNGKRFPLLHFNLQDGSLVKSFENYSARAFILHKNDKGKILAAVSRGNSIDSVSLYAMDKKSDTLIPLNARKGYYWGITHLQSMGSYFLAFGENMIEHDKYTSKPGLFIYSPEDDTVITSFSTPVIEGSANTFAADEKTLVFAGEFGDMNSQIRNENLAFMQMPKLMLKPGVSSWSPQKANTTNPFALSIYGSGFNSNTTLTLSADKQSVAPDSMNITRRKVLAYFDGQQFTPGKWDLKVNITDRDTVSFAQAVTLEKGSFTDTWMHWIGPDRVLREKPVSFYLTYGNRGNQDAYGVFLYVAVGNEQTVQFHRNLEYPKVKFDINWDTIPHYVSVDHFLGEPFEGKVYTLFFPYLPPNFEDAIKLTVKAGSSHKVRFAISKPIFKDYAQLAENMKSTDNAVYNFFDCMYAVADAVVDLTPGLSCAKAAFDNIVKAGAEHYVRHQSVQVEDVANAIGSIALGCIPGGGEMRVGFAIAKGMASGYGAASGIVGACGPFISDMGKGWNNLVAFSSRDPNAKYGPSGQNASRYVPSRHPYNYMVTFENDSDATAPAQRVIITDTLDLSVFDMQSFKAVGFGFGDTSYIYRPQDGDTVDMDMRPEKPYIVRVFHTLDPTTGVLTWYFKTLDPNTYELVSGVDDGFLPPNKKSPEGEGNILYSITPKADLAEGTEIKNSAHIVFDWNEEIPTGTWQNITDDTPPESVVEPLPDVSLTKDFTVSWHGSDAGDGIYSYTVFVSENDSAYYPWLIATHDSSAVFSGEGGVTYKFYSVSTDSAGNKEAAPEMYDAITRVSGTGISQFGTGNKMQMKLYPNPADNRLTIETYFPEKSNIYLTLLNLCGHQVMTPEKSSSSVKGIRKILLDVSHLPAGIYFVRVETRYGIQNRKIIIR